MSQPDAPAGHSGPCHGSWLEWRKKEKPAEVWPKSTGSGKAKTNVKSALESCLSCDNVKDVNAIAIKVDCSDALEKDRRDGLACRVREYFNRNLQMPEGCRVACYFADTDSLKIHTGGPENRGFHAWLPQGPNGFPRGVQNAIAEVGTRNLVYLHGSTCLSDLGLTMTFAHELQHFRQFSTNFALWAANYLLARIVPNGHMEGVWRVPFEIEARICAKTVAVDLFERERVDEFIAERIDHAPSAEFRKDWES